MTTKYTTSLYGRGVYLIYFLLFTPFCIAALGIALFPMPYNEPSLIGKIVLTTIGLIGTLRCLGFIRNIIWFSPRIIISEFGIKYNGFYLHIFLKWEEIKSIDLIEIRGFSMVKISVKNKIFGIIPHVTLDVSGISPGRENLANEINKYFWSKHGI